MSRNRLHFLILLVLFLPPQIGASPYAQHEVEDSSDGTKQRRSDDDGQQAEKEEKEKRYTLQTFSKNVLTDARNLVSRKNLTPFVIGVGAALAVADEDDDVASHYLARQRPAINRVGSTLGDSAFLGASAAGLLLISHATRDEKLHVMSHSLLEAFVLNYALTSSIKAMTSRTRPNGSNSRAFPSGHTSGAFTAATVLHRHYGIKAGIPAFAAASFVGMTRISDNKHYMSDVLAGATLGYIVGSTVSRRAMKIGKHISWTPIIARTGDGSSFTLLFHIDER